MLVALIEMSEGSTIVLAQHDDFKAEVLKRKTMQRTELISARGSLLVQSDDTIESPATPRLKSTTVEI
jgi:hypothetical protein